MRGDLADSTAFRAAARAVVSTGPAEGLLTAVGYAQTSMRVAAAAAVRIGYLQHYFPSRTELIEPVPRR